MIGIGQVVWKQMDWNMKTDYVVQYANAIAPYRPVRFLEVFMKAIAKILLVLTVTSCSLKTVQPIQNNDDQYSKYLVGSWVCDPKDKMCPPAVITYSDEGGIIVNFYRSFACERKIAQVIGKWKIENENLTSTVISSKGVVRLPEGFSATDQIISMTENQKTLKSDGGELQYRIKSKSCVTGQET